MSQKRCKSARVSSCWSVVATWSAKVIDPKSTACGSRSGDGCGDGGGFDGGGCGVVSAAVEVGINTELNAPNTAAPFRYATKGIHRHGYNTRKTENKEVKNKIDSTSRRKKST